MGSYLQKTCFLVLAILTGLLTKTSQLSAQLSAAVELQKIDSVIQKADGLTDATAKMKLLTSTAGRLRYTTNTKRLIDKSIGISKKENNPELLANSYYSLGNFYFYNDRLDSSIDYLEKASTYLTDVKDPFLESSILATKGGVYKKQGAVSQSIFTTMEAKRLLDKIDSATLSKEEKIKFGGEKMVLNNSLANLYNQLEQYGDALNYYNKAYESAIAMKAEGNAGVILANKGDLLVKMGRYDDALAAQLEGRALKLKNKLPAQSIASSELNIAVVYIKLAKYDEALTSLNKAFTLFTEAKNETGIGNVLTQRGVVYTYLQQHDKAIADCEQSKKIALQVKDIEHEQAACKCLYDVYKITGNYKKALENKETHSIITDSLFNDQNIKKLTQVELQYDFNKKQELQNLVIEKKNRQFRQILIGLVVVVLLATLLFLFLRSRIRYQRTIARQKEAIQQQQINELEQQNKLTALNSMVEGQEAERMRIAKDLHDSLGGMLSTVKAHFTVLQNEQEQLKPLPLTGKINDLIENACVDIRRISHNMMPHALTISGLSHAIDDMGEQLTQEGYNMTVETNFTTHIDTVRSASIYRLLQEIVSNIRKHANAKSILIQLLEHNNQYNLIVEDDGQGFDYTAALAKDGLGLKNINSRVEYLNGTISWDTQPGTGTSISIIIPVL